VEEEHHDVFYKNHNPSWLVEEEYIASYLMHEKKFVTYSTNNLFQFCLKVRTH